jgi:RNA polymerase subunit RPABC4/transcription elongation factor Spt4
MQEYHGSSPFKYVFWGVLVLCAIGLMGQAGWYVFGGFRSWFDWIGIEPGHIGMHRHIIMPRMLATILPTITICTLWLIIVAPLVYKDAKRRGMDPWLWATIASFVPFFIGLIIYLVARSNGRATCESCGRPIRSEFKACPYCGHSRERVCPDCSRPVSPDWKLCPYCEHKLKEGAVEGESTSSA